MTTKLERIVVDGQPIWVEVAEVAPSAKFADTSKTGAAAALQSVDVAATLRALIRPVHEALKATAPEDVSVELSLGLKGEVGVFVAKSEGNASLKVTAKWKFGKSANGKAADSGPAIVDAP